MSKKYFYSDSNGKLQFSPNPVKTESRLPAAKASSSSEETPLIRKKPKLVSSLSVLTAPAPKSTDKGKAIVFSGPSPAAKYPMSYPPDEDDWGHQVGDKLAELSKYFLQQRKISRDQSLELWVLAAKLRDRDAELKQFCLNAESYERTIAALGENLRVVQLLLRNSVSSMESPWVIQRALMLALKAASVLVMSNSRIAPICGKL
ncbi:hypothetical protein CASFOL_022770 [Castilleja foliolosa]|uniref:Uncharacterized protein n=1 Tax=Castilleja foliolosa TaxID=1961234 RepID=A0ABD3CU93_9LAMI